MPFFKLFCQLLLTTTGVFIAQPLFSQANKNTRQTVPSIAKKDSNQRVKPIGNVADFPTTINSKLNKDSSVSLAHFIMKNLPPLYIHSGEVYFSGAGFPTVQIILFRPSGPGVSTGRNISNALKELLGRCRAGSEITFVKCSFKNSGGTLSEPINRTVRIQ